MEEQILTEIHKFDHNEFSVVKFNKRSEKRETRYYDTVPLYVNVEHVKINYVQLVKNGYNTISYKYLITDKIFDEYLFYIELVVTSHNVDILTRNQRYIPMKTIPLTLFLKNEITFKFNEIEYFIYEFPDTFVIPINMLNLYTGINYVIYGMYNEIYMCNMLNTSLPVPISPNIRFHFATMDSMLLKFDKLWGAKRPIVNGVNRPRELSTFPDYHLELNIIGIYIQNINIKSFELITDEHTFFMSDCDCIKDEFGTFISFVPINLQKIQLVEKNSTSILDKITHYLDTNNQLFNIRNLGRYFHDFINLSYFDTRNFQYFIETYTHDVHCHPVYICRLNRSIVSGGNIGADFVS